MVDQIDEPPATPAWVDRAAYPFTSRFARVPAGRMHYVDEGPRDAAPILLVHGTPTWSFEWRHVIRALSARHRCVAPDLIGFGLSERPPGFAYSPEAHAAELAAFVDAVGLRRFTLVVHDFGGPIGLPLALDGSGRVARLVVVNTWMWPFDDDPDMRAKARFAGGAVGRWMYRRLNFSLRVIAPSAYGDRKKLTKAIHAQYLAPFPDADSRERVLHALARALLGSSAHYASLWERRARLADVPTRIVWGMRDSAFQPKVLAKWREAVPTADVVEIAGAGHWPHEEEPEAVSAAIGSWVR